MVPSDTSSSSTSSDSSTTSTESSFFSEDSEFEMDNVSTNEPGSSSRLTQQVGEGKRTLLEPLGRWAASSKTAHVHVNTLLKILKPFHPELPLDVRTLLGSSSDPAPFTAMSSDDTSPHPNTSTPRRKRRRHDSRTSTKEKKKKKKKRQYWMLYSQQDIIERLTDLCSKVDNLEAHVRRLVAASTPLPVEEGPAWQQVSSLAAYDRLCAALSDAQYRRRLICYLSGAGGENTSAFAGRIFSTLFTEDVTDFLTFYGKKPGSRAFLGHQSTT